MEGGATGGFGRGCAANNVAGLSSARRLSSGHGGRELSTIHVLVHAAKSDRPSFRNASVPKPDQGFCPTTVGILVSRSAGKSGLRQKQEFILPYARLLQE